MIEKPDSKWTSLATDPIPGQAPRAIIKLAKSKKIDRLVMGVVDVAWTLYQKLLSPPWVTS